MPFAPEIIVKDPDEVRLVTLNCASELSVSATIATITSLTAAPTGPTFAGNSIVAAGTAVSTLISGGTHGTDYTVTLRVTTSDGETIEASGTLRVRNSTGS